MVGLSLGLLACDPSPDLSVGDASFGSTSGSDPAASAGDASGGGESETGDGIDPRVETGCLPPPGVSGSPQSIAEAVALVNALPKPLSLPCFLASLDRPLAMELADSPFSAQPSGGEESPRVFLFTGPLVMSVVPSGEGKLLLEFGEFVDDRNTLKGELVFPVTSSLPEAAAYDHLFFQENVTRCAFCHASESPWQELDGVTAFVSEAIAPFGPDVVAIESLQAARVACDSAIDPYRCEMLAALFDHGEVVWQPFPDHIPTFFE